jgi:dTMP kinase
MSQEATKLKDGLLIVFEGIDGVGKTTQLELAKEALLKEGLAVETSRNLGGTPIGEALREAMLSPHPRPETTNLYLSVAIQEALIEATEHRRQGGSVILMDRGPLSLAAYEIYGSGLSETLGWPHVDNGMKRLRPELTIIYTADVKTALGRARTKSGGADYFESKPLDYFERVAAGYASAAGRYPAQTFMVEADRSIEVIHQETMRLIRHILQAKRRSS